MEQYHHVTKQLHEEIHHKVKCRDMAGQKCEHMPKEPCLNMMNNPMKLNRKCRMELDKQCHASHKRHQGIENFTISKTIKHRMYRKGMSSCATQSPWRGARLSTTPRGAVPSPRCSATL